MPTRGTEESEFRYIKILLALCHKYLLPKGYLDK